MAAPVRSLQLGFADDGNFPEGTTTRRAYDLLAEGFGPGFNGPLLVTAEVQNAQDRAAVAPLLAELVAADGVVSVNGPLPSDYANPDQSSAYMVQVYAATAPQDPAPRRAGGSAARRRPPGGRRRHDAGHERHRLRAVGRRLTVVRLLLVPAAMEMMGARNWWVPRWLDRLLPRLTIERAPTSSP